MDQWKITLPNGTEIYFDDWESARVEAYHYETIHKVAIVPEKVEQGRER
jgi:hypothetical protein